MKLKLLYIIIFFLFLPQAKASNIVYGNNCIEFSPAYFQKNAEKILDDGNVSCDAGFPGSNSGTPTGKTKELKVTPIGSQSDPLPSNFDPKNINTSLAVITFENSKESKFAFDNYKDYYKTVNVIENNNIYDHIHANGYNNNRYDVGWKLVPVGETDVFTAKIAQSAAGFDPDKVIFTTPQGTNYKSVYNSKNQLYTLTVAGSADSNVQEIYAVYKQDKKDYRTLGKVNVISYNKQTPKVTVVFVNSYEINTNTLKTELDKIYKPVGVDWQVAEDKFTYPATQAFFDANSGLLNAYNEQMRDLQKAYKDAKGIDGKTSYIFILNHSGVENNRDCAGFMPRGKQFGYIFKANMAGDNIYNVIAHELGHGQWKLKHTFDDSYGKTAAATQGTTGNLMDYEKNAGALAKWQWDVMREPAIFDGIFDSDEQGMINKYLTKQLCVNSNIDKALRKNGYVLGANNQYFRLSDNAVIRRIAYTDNSKNPANQGAVTVFEENGKTYIASYNPQTEEFISYKEAGVDNSDRKDIQFESSISGGYYPISIDKANCTVNIDSQPYSLTKELCDCNEKTYKTEYAQSFAKNYADIYDDKVQEQVSHIASLLDSMDVDFLKELKEKVHYENSPESDDPASWDYYFKPLFRVYAKLSAPTAERLKGVYERINAYNKACIDLGCKANSSVSDKFTTSEEVVTLVKDISFGGIVAVAQAPFKKLTNEQRKYLLKILSDGNMSGRNNISESYKAEDIVLLIFKTTTETNIAAIAKSLEQNILFRLFSETDDHLYFMPGQFHELVLLVSRAVMSQDKVNKNSQEIAKLLYEEGKYLIFDNSYFGKKNTETFSESNSKVCLNVGREIWRAMLTVISPATGITVDFLVEGKDYSNKCYNPLDYLVIIPVRDIDYGFIQLKKGEMVVVPAVLGYLIFKVETVDNTQTAGMIAINTALCAIGVGELTAAIEAGSIASGILAGVDITLGAAGGVINTVPEIAKDHPEFTKYYNYVTIGYTVARLGFAGYQGVKAKWPKAKQTLVSKLTGSMKATYDDLIKAGYKITDDGVSIIFKNVDDLPIAKIADDALHIKIPDYGKGSWATQSNSIEALNAIKEVNNGASLYRIGTLKQSATAEAQFWSLENPAKIKNIGEFSRKYGLPEANIKNGDFFIEIGKPKANVPKISREAPPVGGNEGGSIEIVVPVDGVQLESFHTIKF